MTNDDCSKLISGINIGARKVSIVKDIEQPLQLVVLLQRPVMEVLLLRRTLQIEASILSNGLDTVGLVIFGHPRTRKMSYQTFEFFDPVERNCCIADQSEGDYLVFTVGFTWFLHS